MLTKCEREASFPHVLHAYKPHFLRRVFRIYTRKYCVNLITSPISRVKFLYNKNLQLKFIKSVLYIYKRLFSKIQRVYTMSFPVDIIYIIRERYFCKHYPRKEQMVSFLASPLPFHSAKLRNFKPFDQQQRQNMPLYSLFYIPNIWPM